MSMGMNTAIKNGQILDDAYGVLGHRAHGRGAGARLPGVHAGRGDADAPTTSSGGTSPTSTRTGRSTPTTPR